MSGRAWAGVCTCLLWLFAFVLIDTVHVKIISFVHASCFCLLLDWQANCYWIWWSRVHLWRIFYVCTRPPDQCKYVLIGQLSPSLCPLSKSQRKFLFLWLLSNNCFISLCLSYRKSAAVCVRWECDICANESQVWSTLDGVSKHVSE